MNGNVLVVRLDSLGDMLICGPAIRAVAASADRVTVLAGPDGLEAARLLPGVDEILEFDCPWIRANAAPVDPRAKQKLLTVLMARATDTRQHNSPSGRCQQQASSRTRRR